MPSGRPRRWLRRQGMPEARGTISFFASDNACLIICCLPCRSAFGGAIDAARDAAEKARERYEEVRKQMPDRNR